VAKASKKRVLGRGLSAILNDNKDRSNSNLMRNISISSIDLNPFQPRTNFNQSDLIDLSKSIKSLGLIQPITVKKNNEKYTLISGERRLRACRLLNYQEVPAYIIEADNKSTLEMALVENIQRKDLDPIEIAISYKKLINDLNVSQDFLSQKIGKDRSTISNYIRLLKLNPIIQSGIRDRFISVGHGRCLISLSSEKKQLDVYEKILKNELSVRQTEKIVNDLGRKSYVSLDLEPDKNLLKKIQKIQDKYKVLIKIKLNKKNSLLSLKFNKTSDLKYLLEKLNE